MALDSERRLNLIKFFTVVMSLMFILGFLISLNPESKAAQAINSTITRFTSLFESDTYNAKYDDTSSTSSLEWRRIENVAALPLVFPPRILGLGMGAWYRDYMPSLDAGLEEGGWDRNSMRGYIHNSHFWVIVKAGSLSYLSLMVAYAITIVRGFQHWRRVHPKYQPFVLASSISLIGLLLSAIVDPILVDLTWSPVCGMILGINEVAFSLSSPTPKIMY